MFLESAGIPFISSLVLLTAGNMITSGKISFISAFTASMIGIIFGSLISYSVGYYGGKAGQKINKKLFFKKVYAYQVKIHDFIERYGNLSIFFAQFLGTTRTFISFPAGAVKMNIVRFLVYTTLGGSIFSLLILIGSLLFNILLHLLFRLLDYLLQLPWWAWLLLILFIFFLYWGYHRH